jgi:diguanylate cyclase (GGDEF)-like protein
MKSKDELSHNDNTTGLPNHLFFNEILNKTINYANRRHQLFALLLISFEDDNITTSKLNEFGVYLSSTLRNEDILAKLDGNEFVVLLNDIGKPKFASAVAEKILKHSNITTHIGICIYPNDGESLNELFDNAEKALFKASMTGQSGYQFHTHEMDLEAREYIQLDSALRNALQNNELLLYYQPRMHVKQGKITGIEALIRWSHPEHGLINAGQFIPLAEESGLIMKIGEWALLEACKINKYWQTEGFEHINVGINLSTKQFYHPDIIGIIQRALKESNLDPQYLEIEITEGIVMTDIEAAEKIFNSIKATGVQISIDHFGTGFTSISHLKRFPVNNIKIDKSFIKGVPNIPNDTAITNAFIALAHNLGLAVIAEGVETAEQVQYLASQQCDMVQGYFLSHPVPAQKIELQLDKIIDRVI